MKILLCRIPAYFDLKKEHPENAMVPIELGYISSIAKQLGIKIELLDLEAESHTVKEIKEKIHEDFDYIVVKAKTPSFDFISNVFKNTKAKIIGIGHLFTTKPEAVFSLDKLNLLCAIKGETEIPFKSLLTNLLQNKAITDVPNLIVKDNNGTLITNQEILHQELDDLPSPDYGLFKVDNYYTFYPLPFGMKKNFGFMMTSRGCPYSCSFCSATLRNSYGKGMRFHSYERIISDLKHLENLGRTVVFFRDDIFTVNRNFTIGLCKEMIKARLKIKWCAQTHINNIDIELLDIMKKAGCVSLGFGLESGSKKILDSLKKTNNIETAPKLVHHAKKIGIKTVCFFLVGCPTENKEDHRLTLNLLKETLPNLIQVAFFTPYPGSADFDKYIGKESGYDYSLHHYNNFKMNLTEFSNLEIDLFRKKLYHSWFFTPQTIFSILSTLTSDMLFNQRYFRDFLFKGLTFFKGLFFNRKEDVNGYKI